MLCITRKANQAIQIGPDIMLTVIEVKGKYVRLGIEAPKDVRVRRTELPERGDGAAVEPRTQEVADRPAHDVKAGPE